MRRNSSSACARREARNSGSTEDNHLRKFFVREAGRRRRRRPFRRIAPPSKARVALLEGFRQDGRSRGGAPLSNAWQEASQTTMQREWSSPRLGAASVYSEHMRAAPIARVVARLAPADQRRSRAASAMKRKRFVTYITVAPRTTTSDKMQFAPGFDDDRNANSTLCGGDSLCGGRRGAGREPKRRRRPISPALAFISA